jgi:hypothetical protein
MTSDPNAARGRSLRDDLLDDLKQPPSRTPVTPAATAPSKPKPVSAATPVETPSVELRITPRSWSPAEWAPLPNGGFVLSVGPIRLSLGRSQP